MASYRSNEKKEGDFLFTMNTPLNTLNTGPPDATTNVVTGLTTDTINTATTSTGTDVDVGTTANA